MRMAGGSLLRLQRHKKAPKLPSPELCARELRLEQKFPRFGINADLSPKQVSDPILQNDSVRRVARSTCPYAGVLEHGPRLGPMACKSIAGPSAGTPSLSSNSEFGIVSLRL